jgi:hypothetical protein
MWRGRADLVNGLAPFVEDGIAGGEAVMVALRDEHVSWLRTALGRPASAVHFVPAELGSNPARMVLAWQEFLASHADYDRPVRGISEPIWAGRRSEEVAECQLHEALLNVVVDPRLPFWLVCLYDTEHLDESVLGEAHCSHPAIVSADSYQGSLSYGGRSHAESMFRCGLPPIPGKPVRFEFAADNTVDIVGFIRQQASEADVRVAKAADLALAARRLALSSLKRGADSGQVRLWRRADALVCEVSDSTVVDDLLAGRRRPSGAEDRDLAWAISACDLAQMRSTASGTTVRLHIWN